MRFIIDENVPTKLIRILRKKGLDTARVRLGSGDWEIARRAKKEDRILVTQDKDFIGSSMYPIAGIDIIFLQVQPSTEDLIIEAFDRLLKDIPEEKFKGLVILKNNGHIQVL